MLETALLSYVGTSSENRMAELQDDLVQSDVVDLEKRPYNSFWKNKGGCTETRLMGNF